MVSSRLTGGYEQRGLALSVLVGVMLSLFVMHAYAQTDSTSLQPYAPVNDVKATDVRVGQERAFSWQVRAELDANYIWRGMYAGGLSTQIEAEISYYGFFLASWWNLGTTDWRWGRRDKSGKMITGFNPELDMSVGYRYKGLMIQFMHMYYFDHYQDGRMSGYFDWRNYGPGEGGVTTEWRLAYRISDKVPLRFMWCTRTFSRDGYWVNGELKRAYSTYIEVKYEQALPHDVTLTGLIGLTPWKSMYTNFEKDFAVVNLSVSATKSWRVTDYCAVDIGAVVMLNPSSMQPMWNIYTGVTFN